MNAMLLIKRRYLLLATLAAARMQRARLPARATGSGLVSSQVCWRYRRS